MQRTLRGQRYDTETATKICEVKIGHGDDPNFLDFTLYQRVRSKDFFLAGFGGDITLFSRRSISGGTVSGCKILPISVEQACRIAKQFADSTVVGKFFGEVEV